LVKVLKKRKEKRVRKGKTTTKKLKAEYYRKTGPQTIGPSNGISHPFFFFGFLFLFLNI